MKRINIIMISLLLMSSTLVSCSKNSSSSIKKMWKYDCGIYYDPKYRYIDDKFLVVRKGSIIKIDLSSGGELKTDFKDLRKIDDSNYIALKTIDDVYYLLRVANDKVVWQEEYGKGEILVYNQDVYFVSENKINKISFLDGHTIWSVNLYENTSLVFNYEKDFLFILDVINNAYYKINNVNGLVMKKIINPFTFSSGIINLSGFTLNNKLHYIDNCCNLVEYPSKIIGDWTTHIDSKFTHIDQINEKIIFYSYDIFPSSVSGDFESSISPINVSFVLSKNNDESRCTVKIFDQKSKKEAVLNNSEKLDIQYAYTINDKIVVFTNAKIICYSDDSKKIWELNYNQLEHTFEKYSSTNVLWFNDDYIFVMDGKFLTCFKIPKN